MTARNTHTDNELLRLMMAGNEAAFTALYRRRQDGVYRFALQMSGSQAIAEDVTQETFITLMREGGNFDPERGTLSSFLYGVARNHVLRRLQRDRLYVPLEDQEDDYDCATADQLIACCDPLGDLTRSETIEAVRNAVLALPPHYREVVVLCDLHEMSYLDAAQVLGCVVGTVRSRLHRARSLLAQKLRTNDAHVRSARCLV